MPFDVLWYKIELWKKSANDIQVFEIMNIEENKQVLQGHMGHLTSGSKLTKCAFEYNQI